jgi:acetoin utilization protein AcuC
MSTLLIHSDNYANWIFDPSHPTQGRRFINARNLFLAQSAGRGVNERAPRPATRAELARVHSDEYLHQVLDNYLCNEWSGARPDLAELAALFAGGTLAALEALISGEADVAIHFPGAKHHAQRDTSSGFCIFADFALAADIATKDHGLKVAILDIDAHHGDGTEFLSAENPGVLTYSIHQSGIFPGTGNENYPELNVFNFPLSHSTGMTDASLLAGVNNFIPIARTFAPDIIFIAAGADGLNADPLSSLEYTVEGYQSALELVRNSFPELPILMGGAGGYLPDSGTPELWATLASDLAA